MSRRVAPLLGAVLLAGTGLGTGPASAEPRRALEADPAADGLDEPVGATVAFDGAPGALAEAEAEAEAIATRLRRARAVRAGRTPWPRLAVALRFVQGAPASLQHAPGEPDALGQGGREGLVWSILATWGTP